MQNRRNSKETKASILDAALQLFGEYGFHKTSISMVAEQAKVYRSAIAFYFGSKTDLLKGVWERYIENNLMNLIHALSLEKDNGNHDQILKRVIELWTNNYRQNPDQMRSMLRLTLDGPQSIPALATRAQQLYHNAHQLMEQLIAQGQTHLSINRKINSKTMADLLMLVVLGIQYGCYLCPNLCTPEKSTADLFELSDTFFSQPAMPSPGSEGQTS